MEYQLPKLPYELGELEPQISRETMEYHYGKHLQAYITKLNELIKGTKYEEIPLEQVIREAEGPLFNNAAQTWNHIFFFTGMAPEPKTRPGGALAEAIENKWGSFEAMKEEFAKAATGQFGSGWAWLAADGDGYLSIIPTSNAENPLTRGLTAVMCIDVWEHAYYIDYRNRRPEFISAAWEKIDWATAEKRYDER